MRQVIKFLLGLLIPHSLVVLAARARARRRRRAREARLQAVRSDAASEPATLFTYSGAVRFLVQRGLDREQVLAGSMPEESLHYCAEHLTSHLEPGAVLGLHIGNFVGLSMAYFSHVLAAHDPASRLVSIDPNVPHRGVQNPLRHALAPVQHVGLERHNLILTGYTLEKNLSNDGSVFAGYDPVAHYGQEESCTHQLEGLARWSEGAFHLCVIDGNHDAAYLRQELAWIDRLLRPGGLLILDDVTAAWAGIRRVYAEIDRTRYRDLGTDGRVAILQKTGGNGAV